VFAAQAEIWDYLERVADEHGVTQRVHFGVELERARWTPATHRWHLDTSRGRYTCDVLVSAAGPWHQPKLPAIDGDHTFTGHRFHSARWNHGYDLRGKRVAVVGTGASAIQFVPAIQPQVAKLHLFQRTAQWVLPKPDGQLPPSARWLFRRSATAGRALRATEYALLEVFGAGFRNPRLMAQIQRLGERHLARTVADPTLRSRLTPDYRLGCKRILMSNDYYPAVAQPNVSVHATGVRRIDGATVLGSDGSIAEVDAIIYGTGFHILDMPIADRVHDADGTAMAARWAGSPRAYLGTTVAGFPNFFMLLGPSLGTGHSSAFTILEAQLDYIVGALHHRRTSGDAVLALRDQVVAAYVADVQRALPGTVYAAGGCASYYVDDNGTNTFSWPWSTPTMERRLRAFDPDAYDRDAGVA
jgi:cation diffusion facilitator CzcD-associated flavoprotein CzcO